MLFKDERFKFIAELIDNAPVACAIVGGAVRDEVAGRPIKDFDIIVHADDASDLLEHLQDEGFIIYEEMGHAYEQAEDKHFISHYCHWYRIGLDSEEQGEFIVDLLILRSDIYKREQGIAPSRNFKQCVTNFDNTMNLWMYYAGSIIHLGDSTEKLAIQLKEVDSLRVNHLKEIAKDIGWTYVPLSK